MPTEPGKSCLADQCPRPVVARGLCDAHRKQLQRTGALTIRRVRGAPKANLPWRVPWYVLDLIQHAAEVDGLDEGEWLEGALMAALCQERYAE